MSKPSPISKILGFCDFIEFHVFLFKGYQQKSRFEVYLPYHMLSADPVSDCSLLDFFIFTSSERICNRDSHLINIIIKKKKKEDRREQSLTLLQAAFLVAICCAREVRVY